MNNLSETHLPRRVIIAPETVIPGELGHRIETRQEMRDGMLEVADTIAMRDQVQRLGDVVSVLSDDAVAKLSDGLKGAINHGSKVALLVAMSAVLPGCLAWDITKYTFEGLFFFFLMLLPFGIRLSLGRVGSNERGIEEGFWGAQLSLRKPGVYIRFPLTYTVDPRVENPSFGSILKANLLDRGHLYVDVRPVDVPNKAVVAPIVDNVEMPITDHGLVAAASKAAASPDLLRALEIRVQYTLYYPQDERLLLTYSEVTLTRDAILQRVNTVLAQAVRNQLGGRPREELFRDPATFVDKVQHDSVLSNLTAKTGLVVEVTALIPEEDDAIKGLREELLKARFGINISRDKADAEIHTNRAAADKIAKVEGAKTDQLIRVIQDINTRTDLTPDAKALQISAVINAMTPLQLAQLQSTLAQGQQAGAIAGAANAATNALNSRTGMPPTGGGVPSSTP